MFVVCVTITVRPEFVDAFIEATLDNARATRGEPGNARFDVLRAIATPASPHGGPPKFFLYEAYVDEAGFATHQRTPHYQAWKERVAPMMAEPRVGVKHHALFPDAWR